MGKIRRGFGKTCANELHKEWSSSSTCLVNLHTQIGKGSVFFKAFRLLQKHYHSHQVNVCTDCLIKCWHKRSFTTRLPENYQSFPDYLKLQHIIQDYLTQSESSQPSQKSVQSTSQDSEPNIVNEPDEVKNEERTKFKEVDIGGEIFCLVPKALASHVPKQPTEVQYLEGIGNIEVGPAYAYIPVSSFPKMLNIILKSVDLQEQVKLCRLEMWSRYGKSNIPPFDPVSFKEICDNAGAKKLFHTILGAMSDESHSEGRTIQNEKRAIAVIYILIFGQSQKASWFQKMLATQIVGKGISGTGLSILNTSGVSVSKSTQYRDLHKTANEHHQIVTKFINAAAEQKDIIVIMVDDYTNIHTKQRPHDKSTSVSRSMATILLKRYCGVPAIPCNTATKNPDGVSVDLLVELLAANSEKLSLTFASVMPHWIRSAFFDPEAERNRVSIHDYQELKDIREMRKMTHCRLIDELELPLKSFRNFLEAATHAADQGMNRYLSDFVSPQPGDWPAQYFMRQIAYNLPDNAPRCLENIVPFIGPLHLQLNARECVCLLHINFLKRAYSWVFGNRKILANKPKAWRISLIEEIVYGGWTLVRDQVIVAFSHSKYLQYLTLLNLLDNYLPLVLSIYSVIFKRGAADQFLDGVLRCWVMFFSFRRHHYDKAPLVWLSNFLFWKRENHPLFQTITEHLNVFDEYPVENFHSLLRAQTRDSDSGELLRIKAKALDGNKSSSMNFTSVFTPPKKYTFSQGTMETLKLSAAEFIVNVLQDIKENPHSAVQVPRPKRKRKSMTYWKLPHLYGDDAVVPSKILPLGYQFHDKEPDPNKKCDLPNCAESQSDIIRILSGCGHSFHQNCFPSGQATCHICMKELTTAIGTLGRKAADAIMNPNIDDGLCDDENEKDVEEDEDETEIFDKQNYHNTADSRLQLQQRIFSWGLISGP